MDKRTEREQRMYDALRRIAKEFQTPSQLQRSSEKQYGLEYAEALEYAYENIQQIAGNAIKGVRRPGHQRQGEGENDGR